MMNLESCSPVQQLSELLAAQTTRPLLSLKPSPTSEKDISLPGCWTLRPRVTLPALVLFGACPHLFLLRSQQEGDDAQGSSFRGPGASTGFFFCLFPLHSHHLVGRQSYCGVWGAQQRLSLRLFSPVPCALLVKEEG